jgi:hypothetical protein
MDVRALIVPIWTVSVLSAIFPAWILLRSRGKKMPWRMRSDVAWANPRLQARIARFVVFSAIGSAAGALVAAVDVSAPFSQSEWHRFLALWVLLPIVSLMAVFTRRRIPWHRAVLWMGLELAGCLCFFQATMERIWTHYNIFLYDVAGLLQLVLLTGVACYIFGAVLLLFLQVKPEKPMPGPYCPECGYCLIGLPKRICSECGRAFTLEELGIGEEALVAGKVLPTS